RAAGGEEYLGDAAGRRVAAEAGAVLGELLEVVVGQQPERPQGGVERPRRVPLGEHERIVIAHDAVVQAHHDVERGEIAADMADAALKVHPQQAEPRVTYLLGGGSYIAHNTILRRR